MVSLPFYDANGERAEAHEFDLPARERGLDSNCLHQAVVAENAGRRQGCASTRARAQVAATTAKMYRQKGTGRARHGARSAPQFRGGGVVFGPHPRSYRQRTPRKMKQVALAEALAAQVEMDGLIAASLEIEDARTKSAAALLAPYLNRRPVLVLLEDGEYSLFRRAARNLSGVRLVAGSRVTANDVLHASVILATADALQALEGRLS